MESFEFYDKYAAIIYGSIFRLIQNKSIADKIFSEIFIDLYYTCVHSKPAVSTIPCLLRSVYSITVKKLEELGLKPVEIISRKDSNLLELLCNKVSNLQEAATITGMSEIEAKKKLRLDLLPFRRRQIAT